MKRYIIYWLDGKIEEVRGQTFEEAFMKAGYGAGAIAAIDYYEEVKNYAKIH